jgi:capsule polysaccharide export protein KpsC/LpsZ
MIETLAAALPKDWVIYVKEHPTQWLIRGPVYFGYRYRGYYEKISKLSNVFLVPINTDSFTLIDKSQALATVTGSAGWEAVLRGKPALVFGYPWYRDCQGVFMVNNTETVRSVLDLVYKGLISIDQNNILHYLVNFGKFSVKGYVEDYNKSISKLNKRENALSLSKAIHEQLSC